MARLAIGLVPNPIRTRIGVAKLTKLSFDGADLGVVWNDLLAALASDSDNTATVMDLSIVAQLMGNPAAGVQLQEGALQIDRLYRSPATSDTPKLRLLALSGATDIGGSMPLEFLLSGSDVELVTLYVVPGLPLPSPLPDHDVALVALGNSDQIVPTLKEMQDIAPSWPRTLLNDPSRIFVLERDHFFQLLDQAPNIVIPQTARISRNALEVIASQPSALQAALADGAFPVIIRPVGSHAGHGLMRIEAPGDFDAYLAQQPEQEFFISRFVEYRSPDGPYRKYRIVFIDGRAYVCHMAIAEEWKVWYLNADMASSAAKRAEEAHFMQTFDDDFAIRHKGAFDEIVKRVGLDYFGIDCAETRDGQLLIFEGEAAMIVHDMDPPDVYPYKVPQMRKVFSAFVAMLHRRASLERSEAA